MDKSNNNLVFISFDADSAGQLIGKAVLNDDPEEMAAVSERIELGNRLFNRWIRERNGKTYSSGGDQGVYSVDEKYINELEELRIDYHYATKLTVSIGIGKHLSESGQALLMAKLKGKDQIVFFDKKTKEEIKEVKKRANKGGFKSMEEQKLSVYLKKGEGTPQPLDSTDAKLHEESCPYCKQTDGVDPDHCKWCHDADAVAGEDSCPYCQNDPSMGAKEPELAEEDCTFCKEMDAEGQQDCKFCQEGPDSLVSADSDNTVAEAGSQDEKDEYSKMGMSPPEIGKPNPSDEPPIGQNAPMDTEPNEFPEEGSPSGKSDPRLDGSIDPEDNHSREALTSIADQIKDEGTPVASQIDAVDDTDLPSGNDMEGNVSHPPGYDQNLPQDMGTGGTNPPSDDEHAEGEEPDLSEVLEEGLNDHADGIQREKAINTVSQALMQFKKAKQSLEDTRMQNPQLYQASISMLKAMIEMATLLGLGTPNAAPMPDNSGMQPQSGQTDSNLGQEQASLAPPQEEQNDEWQDPFPAHPDHGGQLKPGHAPSGNTDSSMAQTNADGTGSPKGAVGQPIGKLSAKNTTKHVARTPMPVGSVNAQGQQKVEDSNGKVRFIDRKNGLVQGPSGAPVKPPKRTGN